MMAEAMGFNGSEPQARERPRRHSRLRNIVLSDQEDSERAAAYAQADPVPVTDPENISDEGDDANGKALAISSNEHDRPIHL